MAVVAPGGTSAEAGTVKAGVRLLERETALPPLGAALPRVTLHVVEAEAARLVLAHCRDVMEVGEVGALMEKVTEAFDAPREAVTVTF